MIQFIATLTQGKLFERLLLGISSNLVEKCTEPTLYRTLTERERQNKAAIGKQTQLCYICLYTGKHVWDVNRTVGTISRDLEGMDNGLNGNE